MQCSPMSKVTVVGPPAGAGSGPVDVLTTRARSNGSAPVSRCCFTLPAAGAAGGAAVVAQPEVSTASAVQVRTHFFHTRRLCMRRIISDIGASLSLNSSDERGGSLGLRRVCKLIVGDDGRRPTHIGHPHV